MNLTKLEKIVSGFQEQVSEIMEKNTPIRDCHFEHVTGNKLSPIIGRLDLLYMGVPLNDKNKQDLGIGLRVMRYYLRCLENPEFLGGEILSKNGYLDTGSEDTQEYLKALRTFYESCQ